LKTQFENSICFKQFKKRVILQQMLLIHTNVSING